MLTFLLTAVLSGKPDLIIVTDDSWQSQVLTHELTREWMKEPNLALLRFNNIRDSITDKVNLHIVHRDSRDKTLEFRIPILLKYPQFRWGRYTRDFKEFDSRTFKCSSFPLLTVDCIVQDYMLDEAVVQWKKECSQLTWQHNRNYFSQIYAWAQAKMLDEISNLPFMEDFEEETFDVSGIIAKYQFSPDFPERPVLTLPPKPVALFPWESPKRTLFGRISGGP